MQSSVAVGVRLCGLGFANVHWHLNGYTESKAGLFFASKLTKTRVLAVVLGFGVLIYKQ